MGNPARRMTAQRQLANRMMPGNMPAARNAAAAHSQQAVGEQQMGTGTGRVGARRAPIQEEASFSSERHNGAPWVRRDEGNTTLHCGRFSPR